MEKKILNGIFSAIYFELALKKTTQSSVSATSLSWPNIDSLFHNRPAS